MLALLCLAVEISLGFVDSPVGISASTCFSTLTNDAGFLTRINSPCPNSLRSPRLHNAHNFPGLREE